MCTYSRGTNYGTSQLFEWFRCSYLQTPHFSVCFILFFFYFIYLFFFSLILTDSFLINKDTKGAIESAVIYFKKRD